jgi:hypothetical protein
MAGAERNAFILLIGPADGNRVLDNLTYMQNQLLRDADVMSNATWRWK